MGAANQRYFAYMTAIEHPSSGQKTCHKLSSPAKEKERFYRGFNPFRQEDFGALIVLMRGEWAISGFRSSDLRKHISQLTPSRSSYLIKRENPWYHQKSGTLLQILPHSIRT